jgi:hypothetical protein
MAKIPISSGHRMEAENNTNMAKNQGTELNPAAAHLVLVTEAENPV